MTFSHIQQAENITNFPIYTLPNMSFKLDRFSKVINSSFEGDNELGDFSCINRSELGRGTHVGVQSYVSDSIVGRFTMIGSRVSLGGFEHPTNWLSVAAFQWGQSLSHYDVDQRVRESFLQNSKPNHRITYIGNDVWIGNNCVIKSGVRISDGAVVGAGAVVTKDVNPYEIVVGNPAKVLKSRFDSRTVEELKSLKWWDLSYEQLSELEFSDINKCIDKLKRITEF